MEKEENTSSSMKDAGRPQETHAPRMTEESAKKLEKLISGEVSGEVIELEFEKE